MRPARTLLARALAEQGRYPEALEHLRLAAPLRQPGRQPELRRLRQGQVRRSACVGRGTGGDQEHTVEWHVPPYYLALVYTAQGRNAMALDALEAAYREQDSTLSICARIPRFDPIRGEPRIHRARRAPGVPALSDFRSDPAFWLPRQNCRTLSRIYMRYRGRKPHTIATGDVWQPASRRGKPVEFNLEFGCDDGGRAAPAVTTAPLKEAPAMARQGRLIISIKTEPKPADNPARKASTSRLEKDLRRLKPATRRTRRGSRPAACYARPWSRPSARPAGRCLLQRSPPAGSPSQPPFTTERKTSSGSAARKTRPSKPRTGAESRGRPAAGRLQESVGPRQGPAFGPVSWRVRRRPSRAEDVARIRAARDPPAELGSLLDLTFGAQMSGTTTAGNEVLFKTSPSGGACHPIEGYVLALRVAGVTPGFYHYSPARQPAPGPEGATSKQAVAFLAGQTWYAGAAAVVFMTAVLPRVWWRYDHPRAYRAALLEAGHVCQTFCLAATWLGLAPFCTMALDDTPHRANPREWTASARSCCTPPASGRGRGTDGGCSGQATLRTLPGQLDGRRQQEKPPKPGKPNLYVKSSSAVVSNEQRYTGGDDGRTRHRMLAHYRLEAASARAASGLFFLPRTHGWAVRWR